MNPKNCEWFSGPKAAMSEMAETSSENIEGASQVLSRWSKDEIIEMMVKYKNAVHPLNSKNDAPVTPQVVSEMMQFHCTNSKIDVKFFEDMERLGNILFLIGTHFRCLRSLILNTKECAQMMQMAGGEDIEFKNNPNASVFQKLFTDQVITADADQQHEVMEDVDDVLAELRGDTPQSSHAHTPNEVLDRLRETLVDPEPSTSEGACNYSLDPETKEYTPRKKAKRNLKNVLDQLKSTMYSSTLQSDEESTPQKKKKGM